MSHTLTYRRRHPGGGALGRCSYGIPGVKGIVVFDVALFKDGNPPATIEVPGVEFAEPALKAGSGVTSAVVADANSAVASNTGSAIASPAEVAKVASAKAAEVVEASKPALKPRVVKAHTA